MFKTNDLLKYAKWMIAGLFIILVAVQANKSFVLDEAEFPMVSQATSQTGIPIYYHGELSQTHVGTYHPTLYINTLALFFRIFGYSEISTRVFGAICVLLSAYLLIRIYRLLSKKRSDVAETTLLGLYLLNPFTIASATLPDIDSTILPVLILLFVLVSLHYFLKKKITFDNRIVLIFAVLFAILLWSKLTTPLIAPVFLLGITYISSNKLKESLFFTVKTALTGLLMFLITYLLYCMALGLSTTYTFGFLIASFTKGTSDGGPLMGVIHNLGNLGYFVYWITIPLVGLLVLSSIAVLLDKTNDQIVKVRKLLIATALLTTIFYIALISPFGGFFKYPFPVFGLLLLSVGFFIEKYKHIFDKLNYIHILISLSVGFIVEKVFWEDSMFLSTKPFEYIGVILILSVAIYFLLDNYKSVSRSLQIVLILLIFFTIGFQFSISRVQALASYPTKYLYGQSGMDEAAEYLRGKTRPDETIWSMKDIGHYVHNKYHESYTYYFNESLHPALINLLKGGRIKYYVATTGIGQDNIDYYTKVRDILDKYATREKQFGNYIIYKAKDNQ